MLLEQHEQLRARLLDAEVLARRFLRKEEVSEELDRALGRLRDSFTEHNRYEEALLAPLLRLDPDVGERRIERMVEEHAEEHRVIRAFLARPRHEIAPELGDWVEEIEAHMEAEERTFLSPRVLR